MCAANLHWRRHRLADPELHHPGLFKARVQRKRMKAYRILRRSVGALRHATHSVAFNLFTHGVRR